MNLGWRYINWILLAVSGAFTVIISLVCKETRGESTDFVSTEFCWGPRASHFPRLTRELRTSSIGPTIP